jgi:O-antigen ligase
MANGRPEGLQALYLISQRPLGYGSQPRLDSSTFGNSLTFIEQYGVVVDVNLPKDWLVKSDAGLAAHSMALDTVVQAGILALPFWMFVYWVAIRRGVAALRMRASPLTVLWTLLVAWNVLFEPLAWPNHLQLAAYLALVLLPLPATRPKREPKPS